VAFRHGKDTKVLANGVDLSQYLNSAESSGSVDTADVTTFGSSNRKYLPGPEDATMSLEGFFDGSADAIDQVLKSALGSDQVTVLYFPHGDAVGQPGVGMQAIESNYTVTSTIDDAARISADLQSKTGFDRVISLAELAARTATGTGQVVDNGAETNNGAVGYLQVTNVSGAGASVAVEIEHSSDNFVADILPLVTFNAAAAPGAQRVEVAGTVKRYVRARWTIAGTTPSITLAVALARK